MIKVTIGESKMQEVKPFPKFMISKRSKRIVFFYEESAGYCFHSGNSTIGNNEHSVGWAMADFVDYNEPITLQNI